MVVLLADFIEANRSSSLLLPSNKPLLVAPLKHRAHRGEEGRGVKGLENTEDWYNYNNCIKLNITIYIFFNYIRCKVHNWEISDFIVIVIFIIVAFKCTHMFFGSGFAIDATAALVSSSDAELTVDGVSFYKTI